MTPHPGAAASSKLTDNLTSSTCYYCGHLYTATAGWTIPGLTGGAAAVTVTGMLVPGC